VPKTNASRYVFLYNKDITKNFFFHPDFTVATGVSPVQLYIEVAEFTASREFHSALKIYFMHIYYML